MVLPTFIGIGVPRGGTTWLNELLETHPKIYMASRRKEVRFFDVHFDQGRDWYASFFCSATERAKYRAVGEISPQYIYCEHCPERIAATVPDARLVLMLRHPVDRAYSQYGFVLQRRNFRGSFPEFLASRPKALEYGFYSRYVSRYLDVFPRSRMLALVSEEAFGNVEATCGLLADFLEVSADEFPLQAAGSRVNPSTIPKRRALAGAGVTVGRRLRRWQMEPIVDFGRRIGVQRMFRGSPLPPIDPEVRSQLSHAFAGEFDELERLLELDLSVWRK